MTPLAGWRKYKHGYEQYIVVRRREAAVTVSGTGRGVIRADVDVGRGRLEAQGDGGTARCIHVQESVQQCACSMSWARRTPAVRYCQLSAVVVAAPVVLLLV